MKRKLTLYFKNHPAMSYAGTLVLFMLIEGLYSFCSIRPRPIDCPPFSDANYKAWFPYQQGQKLYFSSSLGKRDSVTMQVYQSPAYTGSGSCETNARTWSGEPGTFGPKVDLQYYNYPGGNSLNITFLDWNTNATLQDNTITPVNSIGSTGTLVPSITINGKTFSNVVQLQRDTVTQKNAGPYKLWIAKGTGFVGYELFP